MRACVHRSPSRREGTVFQRPRDQNPNPSAFLYDPVPTAEANPTDASPIAASTDVSTSPRAATKGATREVLSDRTALEKLASSWWMMRVRWRTFGWLCRPALVHLNSPLTQSRGSGLVPAATTNVGHTSVFGHNLCVVLAFLYLSFCCRASMTVTE